MLINLTKAVFIVGFLWAIAHTVVLMYVGFSHSKRSADAIVIYGNKVDYDGKPAKILKDRLNKGLALYQKKRAPLIVVSGGTGIEGFDEAAVMKEYLIAKGVPAHAIIEDNKGNNSYLTSKNLRPIAQAKNIASVILVSNYYHILRAKLAMKKFGFDVVYSEPANNYIEWGDLYSVPREIIGYYYYLLRSYS